MIAEAFVFNYLVSKYKNNTINDGQIGNPQEKVTKKCGKKLLVCTLHLNESLFSVKCSHSCNIRIYSIRVQFEKTLWCKFKMFLKCKFSAEICNFFAFSDLTMFFSVPFKWLAQGKLKFPHARYGQDGIHSACKKWIKIHHNYFYAFNFNTMCNQWHFSKEELGGTFVLPIFHSNFVLSWVSILFSFRNA